MDHQDDSLPSLETFKQLAESCEAIELAFRSGTSIDIEAYVAAFPPQFQDMVRPELHGVLDELRKTNFREPYQQDDSSYEVASGYAVIEPLAQGGMGQVMVAWDHDLKRRVALKEIHPNNADDPGYQQRFLQESLITAQLEHPGILPIYNRGINSNEHPFYTMRLVAGGRAKTLHQAIQEFHRSKTGFANHQPMLRDLLRRLIDVCNTVGYAHSQGVCHRDLKPANILIGPFGETLVVDWGLATVFQGTDTCEHDSSVDSSRKGESVSEVVGTRGFASPESHNSDPIADWPRVDVYSLGAILYCMLTSITPRKRHQHRTQELNKKRIESNPPEVFGSKDVIAPKEVKSEIPRALEAVCLKAMSGDPQSRYATPMELADDLDRYLSGQPVSVLAEGPIDRIVRWINNNRKLSIASLLIASLLITSVGGIAVQQAAYNSLLNEKSEKLAESLSRESELRQLESTARQSAETQEQIARKRERLALNAIRTYTEAITNNETLKNAQGLGPIRRELLEKPIALFEQLEQDETLAADPSWEFFEQLAKMSMEIAKLSFEYGDRDQCNRWVDRAIVRYTHLLELSNRSQDNAAPLSYNPAQRASATIELAGVYRLQGMLRMPFDKTLSNNNFLKALDLLSQVDDLPELTERMLSEKSNIHVNQGILAAEQRQPERMAEFFQLAVREREELLEIAEKSSSLQPQTLKSSIATRQVELAVARQDQAHLGLTLQHGDINRHFQQFDLHINSLREQIRNGNATEANRLGLCWALRNLGLHLRNYGQPEKSQIVLKEALAMRTEMTLLYPSVTRYRLYLAETSIDLSKTMMALEQTENAIEYATEGIAGYRSLLKDLPNESSYRVELANQLHFVGHLYLNFFRDNEAQESFEESYTLSKRLIETNTAISSIQKVYPELVLHHAQIQALGGQWHEAKESLKVLWDIHGAKTLGTVASNDERKTILDLWAYCSMRAGDAKTAERVEQMKGDLLGKPAVITQETAGNLSLMDQVKKCVRTAQEALLAADKNHIDGQFKTANELEQNALSAMQQLMGLIESRPVDTKLTQKDVLELWTLTVRNPNFVTVRLPEELKRWPDQDQDAWREVWQVIMGLSRNSNF
jgi:serine/threonine protein kinase